MVTAAACGGPDRSSCGSFFFFYIEALVYGVFETTTDVLCIYIDETSRMYMFVRAMGGPVGFG